MRTATKLLGLFLTVTAASALLHCEGEGGLELEPVTTGGPGVETPDASVTPETLELPFEPVPPYAQVEKVKAILNGLPATNEDIQALETNPELFEQLIDVWAWSPEGEAKLRSFFMQAFQQTQITANDFSDLLKDNDLPAGNKMLENATESFARTAIEIIKAGKPFSETLTTNEIMMTPALMSIMALLDTRHVDDTAKVTDAWYEAAKANAFTVQNTTPTPFADSVNPASPSYLKFYTTADMGTGCTERVFAASRENSMRLARFLGGTLVGIGAQGTACNPFKTVPTAYIDQDFTTWKRVTIRTPNPGEPTSTFWDLPTLRASNTMVLAVPRTGFYSTPAFHANWRTNPSNQMRVTVNQALIVALGASFDPETSTLPLSETGLDAQHADPTTACYACHKLLDPMRSFFRRSYTLSYHEQRDPAQKSQPATFSFGTVQVSGGSLTDFSNALLQHPAYPMAWVQKLCFYADSASCSTDDPEFVRIVDAFKASNYDFRVLIRKLFSSPLVTGGKRTKTFQDREVLVSIARQDHFCTSLKARLGVNACAINRAATQVASNIPRDSYGRGSESPVLTSDVSMFFRTSVENVCREVAPAVIDAATASKWSSKTPDAALAEFVSLVMGLPSADPRAEPSLAILKEHYAAAIAAKAKPTDALRSAFVLACSSPPSVSIGL